MSIESKIKAQIGELVFQNIALMQRVEDLLKQLDGRPNLDPSDPDKPAAENK